MGVGDRLGVGHYIRTQAKVVERWMRPRADDDAAETEMRDELAGMVRRAAAEQLAEDGLDDAVFAVCIFERIRMIVCRGIDEDGGAGFDELEQLLGYGRAEGAGVGVHRCCA